MPRETVRGAEYNFVPLPEGADASTQWDPACRLGVAEVGWSKYPTTGHVELATSDEVALRILVEEVVKAISDETNRSMADREQAARKVIRQFFNHGGFWVTMNREGCNALIRKIRKARDDAFEADA